MASTELPRRQDVILPQASRLSRRVLVAFLLTFLLARILVLLIMLRRMPDLFLYVGGTHVHHLNYGIILLSLTGAATLFWNLTDRHRNWAAIAYGMGLALTFDEFGMWLHLGGSYWQRASYDAVITVAALLGLVWVAPSFARLRSLHWAWLAAILVAAILMLSLATWFTRYAESRLGPQVRRIENQGPK